MRALRVLVRPVPSLPHRSLSSVGASSAPFVFPREGSGVNYALNWQLCDVSVIPQHHVTRNAKLSKPIAAIDAASAAGKLYQVSTINKGQTVTPFGDLLAAIGGSMPPFIFLLTEPLCPFISLLTHFLCCSVRSERPAHCCHASPFQRSTASRGGRCCRHRCRIFATDLLRVSHTLSQPAEAMCQCALSQTPPQYPPMPALCLLAAPPAHSGLSLQLMCFRQ